MYMQFLIFCLMKIDYQMLKICEIFFNDQKKSKILSCYLALPYGYIKKKTNKNVYLHFANLEIRGGGCLTSRLYLASLGQLVNVCNIHD